MKKLIFGVIMLSVINSIACSKFPIAPSMLSNPTEREMDYDINVPSPQLANQFRNQYPNGVRVGPIEAQSTWDYSNEYGGSPNVYFGETSPDQLNYQFTGIVVAPFTAASKNRFTWRDWPSLHGLERDVTYVWVGRFTFSQFRTH